MEHFSSGTRDFEEEIGDEKLFKFLVKLCDEVYLKGLNNATIGTIKRNAYHLLLKRMWSALGNFADYDIVCFKEEPGDSSESEDLLPIGERLELRKNGSSSWFKFMMGYQSGIRFVDEIPPGMQDYAYRQSVDFICRQIS